MRLVLVDTFYISLSTIKMEMQFRKSCNDVGHILWPNTVPDFKK